jgi:hypothetical protein
VLGEVTLEERWRPEPDGKPSEEPESRGNYKVYEALVFKDYLSQEEFLY